MASKQDIVAHIKSSFPGRDRIIDLAYRNDPGFRELCNDYGNCAGALERWRRLNGDEPSPRSEEYGELLTELADEVLTWLDAAGDDPSRFSGNES